MTDAGRLWELYTAEKTAYEQYVALLSGETLVRNQRVSARRVQTARNDWLDALSAVRAVATGTEVADMLQRRRLTRKGGSDA